MLGGTEVRRPAPGRSAQDDRLETGDLVRRLASHPLYAAIRDERALRIFLRSHAFCVLDFMWLLKALQRVVTSIEVPWRPTPDPLARRLVNEIVLDEESDEDGRGGYLSHFEIYLEAMRDAGADPAPIEGLLARLGAGDSLGEALEAAAAPTGAARFVRRTYAIVREGAPHRIAAAFAYGREDVIPEIFLRLVERLNSVSHARWGRLRYYLDRHIERDGDRHGPLGRALVDRLCGGDARRLGEARDTAREALEARLDLWDSIRTEIDLLEK
jgi:hypothetical protein